MSNSSLVVYTKISPNKTSPRNHTIDRITIHHMAGNLSVEACGNGFAQVSRQASSNYGIGTDGRIALYVDEKDRSWCSGSPANDHRAVTIEVANSGCSPNWPVSDKAYAALIDLCVDVCKRNGIKRLNWTGNDSGNLTVHRFYQATLCPGPYLFERMGKIAEEVNIRLAASEEPKTATYPVNIPQLSKGNKGDSVKAMQALLISNGCSCGPTGIDGDFGDNTDRALRDYQKLNGIGQDGICGQKTWSKLLGVS